MLALCCNALMQFNHDNMTGTLLAVDLINHQGDDPQSWERVLRDHGIRRPTLTSESAQELRAWTTSLREVFAESSTSARCDHINELLSRATTRPYLSLHDGLGPHLHFTPDEDDVASRVRAVTAGSLALFTVEAGGGRLGICQRSGCSIAFLDSGRNARRRYCSARCSNYDAVQRHRGHSSTSLGTLI